MRHSVRQHSIPLDAIQTPEFEYFGGWFFFVSQLWLMYLVKITIWHRSSARFVSWNVLFSFRIYAESLCLLSCSSETKKSSACVIKCHSFFGLSCNALSRPDIVIWCAHATFSLMRLNHSFLSCYLPFFLSYSIIQSICWTMVYNVPIPCMNVIRANELDQNDDI